MGNKQDFRGYDWHVWEQFSKHAKNPATEDQKQAIRVVIAKMVEDRYHKNGMQGKSLRQFRRRIETGAPIRSLVIEAQRLGVPYADMSAIVTLLK